MPMKESKWPEQPWDEVIDRVSPLVYRIYAGPSMGTGFVVSIARPQEEKSFYTILATAWHVVEDIVGTNGDIELVSADKTRRFSSVDDNIEVLRLGKKVFDTALLRIKSDKPFIEQSDLLPMLPWESMLARGVEIGSLGFPGLVEPELCFFRGVIAGYLSTPPTYLIDGVTIHGISGGPAFDQRSHIIGLVTAYIL